MRQNEMTVVRVCDGQSVLPAQSERAKKICMAAALCCNVQEQKERGKIVYFGEATELAIVRALTGVNASYEKLLSTAGRRFTTAFFAAMRCTPSESIIVTIPGSASGIAATARLTLVIRMSRRMQDY